MDMCAEIPRALNHSLHCPLDRLSAELCVALEIWLQDSETARLREQDRDAPGHVARPPKPAMWPSREDRGPAMEQLRKMKDAKNKREAERKARRLAEKHKAGGMFVCKLFASTLA
jgi:hypothetical protein